MKKRLFCFVLAVVFALGTVSGFAIAENTETPDIPIFGRPTVGDVNNDGEITASDRVLLARYVAGWQNITIREDRADINKDGEISSADRVILARYIAGWIEVRSYFTK